MIGISVARSTKTNALSVYNPTTKNYYKPDTYKFDPSCLPCNELPSCIHYNGGLMADLYRHRHKNVPEPCPPGMTLKLPSHSNDSADYTPAIVSFIPICDPEGNTIPNQYLLQHHNGSTITKTLVKIDELVDSPINNTRSVPNPSHLLVDSLPA